jgi:hypothetical protein
MVLGVLPSGCCFGTCHNRFERREVRHHFIEVSILHWIGIEFNVPDIFGDLHVLKDFKIVHQTLTKNANGVKTTPAMAAGLTDRIWTVADIVALMDPAAARIE